MVEEEVGSYYVQIQKERRHRRRQPVYRKREGREDDTDDSSLSEMRVKATAYLKRKLNVKCLF